MPDPAYLITETWNQRDGDVNVNGAVRYRRIFRVRVANVLTTAATIRSLTGIPRLFDPYPGEAYARVQSIQPRNINDDPHFWEVIVNYSSEVLDKIPWFRPFEIKRTTQIYQKAIERTQIFPLRKRRAIVNSTGDQFDPPLEIDDCRQVLSITRNVQTYDADAIIALLNTTNATPLFGSGEDEYKFSSFGEERLFEKPYLYYKLSCEFHFSRDGWKRKVLDRGYREYHLLDPEPVAIRDPSTGLPVSQPVLLDGHGQKLPRGGEPVFLEFVVYPEEDWDVLTDTLGITTV